MVITEQDIKLFISSLLRYKVLKEKDLNEETKDMLRWLDEVTGKFVRLSTSARRMERIENLLREYIRLKEMVEVSKNVLELMRQGKTFQEIWPIEVRLVNYTDIIEAMRTEGRMRCFIAYKSIEASKAAANFRNTAKTWRLDHATIYNNWSRWYRTQSDEAFEGKV